MNPAKTTLLLVGTPNNLKKTSSFHLNISGHVLTPSTSVKMLGVTVDRTLSWEEHISTVVASLLIKTNITAVPILFVMTWYFVT